MMEFRLTRRGSLLTVALLMWASTASALEGRIQISEAPFAITAPGSYVLTKDLLPTSNTTAITVTSDWVTIELNGFAIRGPNTCSGGATITCTASGTGVGIDATGQRGLVVKNGSITGTGAGAVIAGQSARIHDVHFDQLGADAVDLDNFGAVLRGTFRLIDGAGVLCPRGCRVTDSSFHSLEGNSIDVGDSTLVRGNAVGTCGGNGIEFSTGSVIQENSVTNADMNGINSGTLTGFGSVIVDNTASDNNQQGILASRGSVVVGNTVGLNTGHGMLIGHGSLAMENAIRDNGGTGIVYNAPDNGPYGLNVINGNAGGDANPQTQGGLEITGNVCGGSGVCP